LTGRPGFAEADDHAHQDGQGGQELKPRDRARADQRDRDQ
jgi:hypothetical protein